MDRQRIVPLLSGIISLGSLDILIKDLLIGCFLAITTSLSAVAQVASPAFRVIKSIDGPDSRWDLVTIDGARHRLYMARVGGVAAIDLLSDKVSPNLVSANLIHGVALVGSSSMVVASNAHENAIVWFEGSTGDVLGQTKVGKDPDGVVYDPATQSVVSVNAKDLTIVSVAARKVVASVLLRGEPEFAVVDGNGYLYDNLRDRHEIVVVDLRKRAVVKHYPLTQCEEPTGLAYDPPSSLLVSVCGSGMAKIISAIDGHDVASIKVGAGADAVILDSARRLVFIPSGHSGTLSVITLQDPSAPQLVQTLTTKVGTRTGALDPDTGRVYLPSAEFQPAQRGEWPNVIPGTMKFLVVGLGSASDDAK